ncbi:hypothetical protein ACVWYH_005085 [Bradyrhizobium sp. GM24.11]
MGSNFKLCEVDGFDELFSDLDKELARQQRNLGAPVADAKPDFDDRPMGGETLADLDLDLALHTAHQYSRKIGLREPSAATLRVFLRELGLPIDVGGVDRPSIAAILLFGRDPQRFLPHAVVTVTDGKKRKVITGNLLKQRKDLLEWVEQEDVNPILKVKVRGRHEERRAYHERALIELCINLLVHRDYTDARPATIQARETSGVAFLNPGRLEERIAAKLKFDAHVQFEPVRELTSPRNRALCDIFYGMSVMERAGTGLADVLNFAKEGDGTAVFSVPPGSDDFSVEIFQPTPSGKSSSVARDTRPIGTYIVNLMPFASYGVEGARFRNAGGDRQEGAIERNRHRADPRRRTLVFRAGCASPHDPQAGDDGGCRTGDFPGRAGGRCRSRACFVLAPSEALRGPTPRTAGARPLDRARSQIKPPCLLRRREEWAADDDLRHAPPPRYTKANERRGSRFSIFFAPTQGNSCNEFLEPGAKPRSPL